MLLRYCRTVFVSVQSVLIETTLELNIILESIWQDFVLCMLRINQPFEIYAGSAENERSAIFGFDEGVSRTSEVTRHLWSEFPTAIEQR